MILGFGVTEEREAKKILQECIDEAKETGDFEQALKTIDSKRKELSEGYDEMPKETAPERYTYFFHNSFKGYIKLI